MSESAGCLATLIRRCTCFEIVGEGSGGAVRQSISGTDRAEIDSERRCLVMAPGFRIAIHSVRSSRVGVVGIGTLRTRQHGGHVQRALMMSRRYEVQIPPS